MEAPYPDGRESSRNGCNSPSHGGIRFVPAHSTFRQITDVREYRFNDIRNTDRVIDIGANVGAFCIRAARYSPYVTAVEPVATAILEQNVQLNRTPVHVIRGALGDGSVREITWDDTRVTLPTFTLAEIIRLAGGCDFLKCDCEGAEWEIEPDHLAGVRRIEMELHLPPLCRPPDRKLLEFLEMHYNFQIDRQPCHGPLGVMGVLHAERKTVSGRI